MARYLIYGCTGYTGRLIIEAAKRRGHQPLIAGRSAHGVMALAEATGLEARVFTLDAPAAELAKRLDGVGAVLHCAGPFSRTMPQMLAACLKARVSYLDITGELDVFERIFAEDRKLKDAGIAAIPGVGFDVVPSDCLAALLARRLPSAVKLKLAIAARGGLSPGTVKTALEVVGAGTRVRRSGRLSTLAQDEPLSVPFPSGAASCWRAPLGDLSTAYRSTGIGDIDTFLALPGGFARVTRLLGRAAPIMRLKPARAFLERRVDAMVRGPDAEKRRRGRTEIWGEVEDAAGARATLCMRTGDGYDLTAEAATAAVERVLAGGVPSGASTPSTAFGADFAQSLPGVELV